MKVILPILPIGHWSFDHWLPWQRPLKNWKKGSDRSSTNKHLLFGEKIAKIGPVDLDVIGLRAIIKKEKN